MESTVDHSAEPLALGWQSLAAGAWEEARTWFHAALRDAECAAAWEGLGWAAWWLNDVGETFRAREAAYRQYRHDADDRGAARLAIALAADHVLRRGEQAIANG